MPNKKILQLTEVITPLNSDFLPIVSGGDTKKVQVSNLPISKSQIGLSNVDNTSDANKPISTATQTALNSKADSSVVSAHISDTNNPHATTKSQVGLGNVQDVDTTNADNITSGELDDARLSSNVTTQGNTFNSANKLVQLDAFAKLPAVDGSQLTNIPLFSPPNGLLRLSNAISTTLQSVTDYLGNLSVLQLNSRRLGIASDSGVTTQTTAVIQATTTNSGIAIVPNGTGAIMAQVPDGTVVGGNARGQNAVDLQMQRSNTLGVASGNFSVISGGSANRNSGQLSTISGGFLNVATSSYNFIGGGQQNTTSSEYSTISGGQSNTASTNSHATVVGGSSNTSSGQYSISGGFSNVASAQSAIAIGHDNDATAISGFAYGRNSVAYLYGQSSNASAFFTTNGDAQQSYLTARKLATLDSAGTTILSLDGTGTTNLIIPNGNNRAWNVTVEYVAVCTVQGSGTTVVGDVVTGTDKFRFKRVGGTSTIGAVTNIELTQDATMAASTCTYAVGTSNSLQITFVAPTTANATTFRVVAKVSLVEVAW
jgi:hypothetical protein